MKIVQICKNSGLICENFGYFGKIKKLSDILKYSPQHLISNGEKVRLLYYKPSYDNRYVELIREEINSIRIWNESIHKVLVFVFNYTLNKFIIFNTFNKASSAVFNNRFIR